MKKLNAKQILEIVEKNWSVKNFGDGGWWHIMREFTFSDNVEKIRATKEEAHSKLIAHPDARSGGTLQSKSSEYQSLYNTYHQLPSHYDAMKTEILQQLGLGKVVEVEQVGGSGQGDEYYSVKHFVDHDVYIRTEGWYSSYEGTTWDNGYGEEVFPIEKTIIVYEPRN